MGEGWVDYQLQMFQLKAYTPAEAVCSLLMLCSLHQAFAKQFNLAPDDLDMHVIYDVSHNIAKVEEHFIDGRQKTLLVHRKVGRGWQEAGDPGLSPRQ